MSRWSCALWSKGMTRCLLTHHLNFLCLRVVKQLVTPLHSRVRVNPSAVTVGFGQSVRGFKHFRTSDRMQDGDMQRGMSETYNDTKHKRAVAIYAAVDAYRRAKVGVLKVACVVECGL